MNRLKRNFVLPVLLLLPIMIFCCSSASSKERMIFMNLLPQPKSVVQQDGVFTLSSETRIFLPPNLKRPEWLAVTKMRDLCEQTTDESPMLDRLASEAGIEEGIFLKIKSPQETDPLLKDGYQIEIGEKRITLTGNSDSGLFYALQTFNQIIRQFAPRLPAMTIEDHPDFIYRGFYHDVCRGKVPKLETLKWLVDYLAQYKINQFQLYIEHTFAFRFDPDIAKDCSPLQPDEILELQEYCRDRHIDLVPSIQSFGHMGHILSLPQYRHLADVELEKSWEDMSWHERMMGATINPIDPEAQNLLEKMYADFLPLFDSKFVNVCADETYDLGKGRSHETAEKIGKDSLYLQHIEFLNSLCKKYGKRMMFWGDVVKHHPDRIADIPKDTILLNWGYHQNTKVEQTKLFSDANLEVFVCPGTSGWNRIMNGINNADLNIRRFAQAGRKYGATGLLNTDWGDHGHYNLLSGSLHGIALGAAMAWNTDGPDAETFDSIWTNLTWDDDHGRAARLLREVAKPGDLHGSWHRLYVSMDDLKSIEYLSDDDARQMIRDGKAAARQFDRYAKHKQGEDFINAELSQMCRTSALLGEKVLLSRQIEQKRGHRSIQLARRLDRFADQLEELYGEYEVLWRARNKESNLRDIRKAINNVLEEARTKADEFRQ